MKRNFLFMLLLTLLPFVGWAQGNLPEGRDLTYTGSPQKLVTKGGDNWHQILYAVVKVEPGVNVTRPVWDAADDAMTPNAPLPTEPVAIIDGNVDGIPEVTAPGTYRVFWACRQSGNVTAGRWNMHGEEGGQYYSEGQYQNVGYYDVTIKVQTFVEPLTDVEMTYGSKLSLSGSMFALTPSEFSTPELKAKVVNNFQINEQFSTEDIGLHSFTIGKKDGEQYSNIIDLDGVTYIIQPKGTGKVKINKADNSLVTDTDPDGYLFDLANAKFTDQLQDLVVMPEPAEGETEAPKVTAFGEAQFYSISLADYRKAFEDAAIAEAQEESETPLTEEQIAQIKESVILTEPREFTAQIKDNQWLEPGVLPQGKAVDTYYVWAKAAAGANWNASKPDYVGEAHIIPGDAVFAGTIAGIPNPFYFRAEGWKLDPSGVTAKIGTVTAPVYYTWQIQTAPAVLYAEGDELPEGKKVGDVKTPAEWGEATELDPEEAVVYTVGDTYKVTAWNEASEDGQIAAGVSEISTEFTVVKPTVKIKTKPYNVTLAYDTKLPTFTYEVVEWQDNNPEKVGDPTVSYVWKKKVSVSGSEDRWDVVDPADYDGKLPVGTYNVYTVLNDGEFTFASHDIVYVPAKVLITLGDIVAKIDDQPNLVYGDPLPLTLRYLSGDIPQTNKTAIDEFENFPFDDGHFTAKMILDADGNKPEGEVQPIPLYGWPESGRYNSKVYRTTLLDAGTYEVSFEQDPDDTQFANTQILTNQKATWTIARRDISTTSGTPRVIGFNDFSLTEVYTSDRIVPVNSELKGKFDLAYYGRGTRSILGVPVAVTVLVDEVPLVPGHDFEIANPGANKNAGEDAGSFDVVGKGNYVGTQHLTFDIEKATINVKPKANQSWTIGADENYLVDYDDIKATLKADFKYDQNLDLTTANGFKDLYVQSTVGTKAGTHEGGLIVVAPKEADNYKFNPQSADLVINPGTIKLKVKNLEVDYAGTLDLSKENLGYGLELADGTTFKGQTSEASKILEENWEALVTGLNDVTFKLQVPDPKKYNVGTYKITAELASGKTLTSTNYDVELVNPLEGTLTVNPVELTISGKEFEKPYSELLTSGGVFSNTKWDTYVNNIKTKETRPNDVPVRVLNDESLTIEGLQPGDIASDVVERIDVGAFDALEPIAVTPVAKANANYKQPYTIVPGSITIKPLEDVIELTSQMEDVYKTNQYGDIETDGDLNPIVKEYGDKSRIARYKNSPVQTIKLTLIAPTLTKGDTEDASFAKWEKNQWHALVLPFAVTARDLSYAFGEDGYVIVNLADAENTKVDDVKFALPEDIDQVIPANTPFCIKTADAFEYPIELTFSRNLNKYDPFIIVAPAADIVKDETFENQWNYTFEGSYMDKEDFVIDYTKSYLRFLGPKKWNYIKNTTTNATYNLPPYNGYVNLGEGNIYNTREITFTFEEEDGSTTAIKDVDFVNGNKNAEGLYRIDGVKVQGTTTQKGVYIQDGKKFVK